MRRPWLGGARWREQLVLMRIQAAMKVWSFCEIEDLRIRRNK